jgi:hypothetical protein
MAWVILRGYNERSAVTECVAHFGPEVLRRRRSPQFRPTTTGTWWLRPTLPVGEQGSVHEALYRRNFLKWISEQAASAVLSP